MNTKKVAIPLGLFLSFALLLLTATHANAAPIQFVPVTVTQPDGTILHIFASGDEYYNWLHDKDGYTIIQNHETGFYVYANLINGELIPTNYIVGKINPASTGLSPNLNISPDRMEEIRRAFLETASQNTRDIANAPHTGTITNLVVFIRFSGESEFTASTATYTDMLNSTTAGANSLRNYFQEVSYSTLTFTSSLYPTPPGTTVVSYQDSHARGYYQPYDATTNPIGYEGGDDGTERREREHTLLRDAINHVVGLGQFPSGSTIDGDGDGIVDSVTFVVRGSPTGWNSLLWAHKWNLSTYTVTIDGKTVDEYAFQMESTINTGVLAHESFHVLGSPDLYHYSGDGMQPVGGWDVMEIDMDPPQHMGCFMKFKYGEWISSLTEITSGTYTLNPVTSSTNNCYKIASPNSTTEYFVVEYRRDMGTFESSLPGSGLLVYRINSSASGNAYGPPDEVYIYRPGGTTSVNGNINTANFSSDVGRTVINDTTDPSSFLADGSAGGLQICNVGAAGSTISFTVGSACSSNTNDDFDIPEIIGGLPYTNTQDTTTATTAADDPIFTCGGGGQKYNTVWYRYTPTASTIVTLDTFTSNFDTVLAVWTGSRGSLTSLGCSDDAQDNSGSYTAQSKVVFTATAGTTYYIEVASYFSGSGGSLTLHAALANDNFDTPEVINSTPYSQTLNTSAASTAADDPVFPCGSGDTGSNSVWYQFTPSENGTLLATTVNSNYDTMLAVWMGSRGSLSNVACNDDYSGLQSQVTPDLVAGTTYYIEVAGYGAGTPSPLLSHKVDQRGDRAPTLDLKSVASGNLNLNVSFTPSGTVCGGGSNSALFTSSDNEDNVLSGNGDCDMDTYLYNTDPLAPIEFNISVPSVAGLTSVELLLLNYDVDEDAGEVDEVYFNGHYAGTLTGASDTWSTTVLTLDPAWVTSGNNLVQIYIDVTNTGFWAVTTDWGQLLLNGQASGTAYVDTTTLNKTTYTPGETVHVTADIDTSLISQNVRTEINLRNSSGIILDGTVINHAISGSTDDPVSVDLVIPASSLVGSYNIQVLVYDSGTNLIQDSKVVTFDVKNPTMTFRSTAAQDGWILESTEISNAGGTMNATATSFNLGDGTGDKQYRSILSFNTATLPDTAVITRATLRIRVYGTLVGNNSPFAWGQGLRVDVCKGTFGTSILQLTDFNFNNATNCKLLAGTFGNTPVNGWYTVNLISTARPKINLTGLTQFRLRFYKDDNDDNAADYWRFYSGNYATASLRPTLIIEYYIP